MLNVIEVPALFLRYQATTTAFLHINRVTITVVHSPSSNSLDYLLQLLFEKLVLQILAYFAPTVFMVSSFC